MSTNVDTNDRHKNLPSNKRGFSAENGPAPGKEQHDSNKRNDSRGRPVGDSKRGLDGAEELITPAVPERTDHVPGQPQTPSIAPRPNATDVTNQESNLSEEEEIARRRALRREILARHRLALSSPSSPIHSEVNSPASAVSSTPASPHLDDSIDLTSSKNVTNASLDESEDQIAAADFDPDADRIAEHEVRRAHQLNQAHQSSTSHAPLVPAVPDDEDDMFADIAEPVLVNGSGNPNDTDTSARKLDETMLDSWADTEGYYRIMIGELLDNRYAVQSILGKGVFSAVVKAVDQDAGEGVAIKVIRNNDLMRKAGLKEIGILETLMKADPDDRKHIVRLKRTFEHRGHLCLVFESLSLNLREVLKKFGRDVGINLKAVRAYAQQIFLALSLMRKCNIMHADLKPDNILVSESRTLLKLCDLGSASDVSENALTPYLASRFYRAPEVILGLPYDAAMDVWAIGCTLYEMYTGKILFPGRSNNQMLRLFMECRGKIPQKLLKKAAFTGTHFDDQLNFNSVELDKVTNEETLRVLSISKPTKDLKARLLVGSNPEERGMLVQFIDLLERCLDLDTMKRIVPSEALKHPFLARAK